MADPQDDVVPQEIAKIFDGALGNQLQVWWNSPATYLAGKTPADTWITGDEGQSLVAEAATAFMDGAYL